MNDNRVPLDWLPTLPRRYAATAVDGALMLAALVAPTALWGADDAAARITRAALAVGAFLVYEPLCTGRFVTLGQWVAGVRVRRFRSGERIGVPRAFVRLWAKFLLGFISFLIIPFIPGRRAIHDLASGSIVITADAGMEFTRWASLRLAAERA
jgi:uncharacterized RDD family membrane protein YckC